MGSNPPSSTCLGWLTIPTDCRPQLCLHVGMVLSSWQAQRQPGKTCKFACLAFIFLTDVLQRSVFVHLLGFANDLMVCCRRAYLATLLGHQKQPALPFVLGSLKSLHLARSSFIASFGSSVCSVPAPCRRARVTFKGYHYRSM